MANLNVNCTKHVTPTPSLDATPPAAQEAEKHMTAIDKHGMGDHGAQLTRHPLVLGIAGMITIPLGLTAITTGVASVASAASGDKEAAKAYGQFAKQSAQAFEDIGNFMLNRPVPETP